MNKIRIYKLLIWSVLLFTQQSFAQEEDVKAIIRDIKLNESYIYGEGTDEDKNIAYDIALQEIINNINEMRLASNKSMIKSKDIVAQLSQYSYNRGEAELVFVYIPVSQAMNIVPYEGPKFDLDTQTETPVQEYPGGSIQSGSNSGSPSTDTSSNSTQSLNIVASSFGRQTADEDILVYILTPTQTTDLIKTLERFQSEGKISQIKNARSFEEIPDDAYVIAYDREHTIKAVFSPVSNGVRMNYKIHKEDEMTNYRGCGFFWFK